MKCIRAKCRRKANSPGQMCVPHYNQSPHGFVDPAPAKRRIQELRTAGMSWPQIEKATGLSTNGLKNIGGWTEQGRVCLDTHERIMAVPAPKGFVDSMARIPAVGTHRRIQGLMAIGWTQGHIGAEAGLKQTAISATLHHEVVSSATAARIKAVFDRLHMTPGPSPQIVTKAGNWGYHVPLAWDEDTIDDPAAKPDRGRHAPISASERIEELHDLGVTDIRDIAERLGIQPESVERQLFRIREVA